MIFLTKLYGSVDVQCSVVLYAWLCLVDVPRLHAWQLGKSGNGKSASLLFSSCGVDFHESF